MNLALQNENPLKLHHTIIKAAARRNVIFVAASEGKFRLVLANSPEKQSAEEFDRTSEALDAFDSNEVTFVAPRPSDTGTRSKCGAMAVSYHDRYSHNPHGPGSNDQLDCAMRELLSTPSAEGAKHKPKVDTNALFNTGRANSVWNSSWASLNPGMQRMNLANRLRARLRNNPEGVRLVDGSGRGVMEGRFGIEYTGKKGKGGK